MHYDVGNVTEALNGKLRLWLKGLSHNDCPIESISGTRKHKAGLGEGGGGGGAIG